MNRGAVIGVVLVFAGLAGYALGVSGPYPGRAFSVTALMIGIALVSMRRAFDGPEEAS